MADKLPDVTDDWVPWGLTEDEAERYRVLVDGVPSKLRNPLLAWLKPLLVDGHGFVAAERTRHVELLTDVTIGVSGDVYLQWETYSGTLRSKTETELLRLVDAALSCEWYGSEIASLDETLRIAKSRWTVGARAGKPGLVSRVPEGVQDMVEATIASSGTAGQLLARAWGKVHGITPDSSGGYADAVKAVEIAAQPLVEPDNDEATLGGIAGVMRTHGDWRLPLREHDHAPTTEMLVAMCRSLYRGHRDRHGSDDYSDVSPEEAEAGVVLAATLVSWFSSGAVQRRP